MTIGGDLDVQSVQNVSTSTNQDFAANLQGNLLNGQIAGGVSIGSGHAARAWVDDQTEIIGGNGVVINVAGDMNNTGALIANRTETGEDGGNLNINVGGDLTYANIDNFDNFIYRNVGYSVGVNTDQNTNGSGTAGGNMGSITGQYEDSKKEGITRATIGEGTITVDGQPSDGEGINRNINKAQEVTFEEGMEVTVQVPVDLIKDLVVKVSDSIHRAQLNGQLEEYWQDQQKKLVQTIGEEQAKQAVELAQQIVSGQVSICGAAIEPSVTEKFAVAVGEFFIASAEAQVACAVEMGGIILISALIISKSWQSISAEKQQILLKNAEATIDSDGNLVDSEGKNVANVGDEVLGGTIAAGGSPDPDNGWEPEDENIQPKDYQIKHQEKEFDLYGENSLKRSYRSLEKQIEKHQQKIIENPDSIHSNHWKKEIQNFRQTQEAIKQVLNNKGVSL